MEPIRAIVDLPFRRREVLDLLNLREHREAPDADYTGYGWARVDEVQLESSRLGTVRTVHDSLLVAVHTTEEPEEIAGDLELEFFVPEVAADYSVTVLLSAFLRIWVPSIRLGNEGAVVLVACNPRATRLPRPPSAEGAPFHYPLGDVESWLCVEDGRPYVRLVADAWEIAESERG